MALGKNLKRKQLIPDNSGNGVGATKLAKDEIELEEVDDLVDNSEKEAKVVLQPSKRRKIKKTKVYVEGKLTLDSVEYLKSEILPVFDNYDYVDFYLKDVTDLDLSCIQMLFYLKKIYGDKGKEVTVDSELQKDLKDLVVAAGYERLMIKPKLS